MDQASVYLFYVFCFMFSVIFIFIPFILQHSVLTNCPHCLGNNFKADSFLWNLISNLFITVVKKEQQNFRIRFSTFQGMVALDNIHTSLNLTSCPQTFTFTPYLL